MRLVYRCLTYQIIKCSIILYRSGDCGNVGQTNPAMGGKFDITFQLSPKFNNGDASWACPCRISTKSSAEKPI